MQISLAPMEGITTYIYRNAINRHFGGIDTFYTPFLTASHIKGREMRDVNPDNNEVSNLIPQILTNDAELFLTIARQLEALGYKKVNLNLGCPSGTVTAKGRGAGFLDQPDDLDEFLDEIYSKCPIEITVKTRIGMCFLSEWEDIAAVYKKYPIKTLVIHPRVGKELYKGSAHIDIYKEMVEMLSADMPDTEFIYNGDIDSVEKLEEISKEIDVSSAIMIGRGLIADPSLAYQINNGSRPEDFKERFKSFHEELLTNYQTEMSYDDQVVKKMKELWSYLGKGLGVSDKSLKELLKVKNLSSYKNTYQMILSQI